MAPSDMATNATGAMEVHTSDPSLQLCTHCKTISFPDLLRDEPSEPIPHYATFGELQQSADKGCVVCRLFWSSIVTNYKVTKETATIFTRDLSEIALSVLLHRGDLALEVKKGSEFLVFSRLNIRKYDDEKKLASELETRRIKLFEEENIPHELETLVKERILPWLKDCNEGSHGNFCRHIHSDKEKVPPTRLIYVDKSNHGSVKLVEMNPQVEFEDQYLILSYCWGQGNKAAQTTRENYDDRLGGIDTADLPKTIRDAIVLTRTMGFEYLWIDAVCIIQDDDHKPSDFDLEAPKMGNYYSNAECCISASLAGDSSEGFLTERFPLEYPIPTIVSKFSDPSTAQPSQIYTLRESDEDLENMIRKSPLMYRGWYMQEYLLSPRKLHWTYQGLFLQCPSHTFPEDSTVNRGGLWVGNDLVEGNPRYIFENKLSGRDVANGDDWYKLLTIYSKKRLKYERDRLNAIQGVARDVVERVKRECLNGILRGSVAGGLVWRSEPLDDPEYSLKQDWTGVRRLPTWCWARSCPVYFTWVGWTVFLRENHPKRLFPMRPNNQDISTDDDVSTDEDIDIDEDISTDDNVSTDEDTTIDKDISTDDNIDAGDVTKSEKDTELHIKAPLVEVSFERVAVTIERGAITIERGAVTIERGASLLKNKRQGYPVVSSYECSLDNRLERDGYPFAIRKSGDREYCTVEKTVKVKWLLLGGNISEKYIGILVQNVPGKEATYERYGLLEVSVHYKYPHGKLRVWEKRSVDPLEYEYETDDVVEEWDEIFGDENHYGKLRKITLV